VSEVGIVQIEDIEDLDWSVSSISQVRFMSLQHGLGAVSSPARSACQLDKDLDLPRAAVLSVPKARYFSKDGSQTSISPSRMILTHQLTQRPTHFLTLSWNAFAIYCVRLPSPTWAPYRYARHQLIVPMAVKSNVL
jgi:hypothetical protein